MTSASQAAAMAAFNSINKSNTEKTKDKAFKIPVAAHTDSLPYIPKSTHRRNGSTQSLPRIKTCNPKSPQNTSGATGAVTATRKKVVTPVKRTADRRSIHDLSQVSLTSPASATTRTPRDSESSIEYFSLPAHSLVSTPTEAQGRARLQGSPSNPPQQNGRSSTITKSSSTKSNLTLNKAKAHETINNLKQSLNSKALGKSAADKRLSQDYAPQEMLSRIKQSFNEKAKQTPTADVNKNQDRINEIRQSIDNKRVSTTLKPGFLQDDEVDFQGGPDSTSSLGSSYDAKASNNRSSMDGIRYTKENNQSSTSVGSSLSYSGSGRSEQPAIVISDERDEFVDFDQDDDEYEHDDDEEDEEGGEDTRRQEFLMTEDGDFLEEPQFHKHQNRSNEAFQKPITPIISHASTASPVSPIIIPPSVGASAREEALGGSSESLHLSQPNRQKFQSFDSAYTSAESTKSKPKRKPPPELENGSSTVGDESDGEMGKTHLAPHMFPDSVSKRYSGDFDSSFSGSEKDYSDINSEVTATTSKLPQFPGLNEKSAPGAHSGKDRARGIFKKKNKIANIDLSLVDRGIDPLLTPTASSRPGTPLLTHQTQPVQLKTTMRKAQKKKKLFNEEKPWKNHTDLSFVTEGERKRYEGLWTSNKGLYINNVATKLKGVKYDSNDQIAPDKETRHTNDSTKAAQLSAQSTHEITNWDDFKQFHNLEQASTDNLILGAVVKRIWNRSKLPEDTLEQIWNLVDYRNDGTLNKHEFVVGMWLVDQCLYGRKLPKKVDNEVWASLENIGLNVVIRKRNKK